MSSTHIQISEVEEEAAVAEASDEFRPEEMEYETQYFGFGPKSFVDSLYNSVFSSLVDDLDKLNVVITKKCPGVFKDGELAKAMTTIQVTMIQNLNNRFVNLEKFASENVFSIPPYVCLPEDEVHLDKRIASVKKVELENETREIEQKTAKIHFMDEQMDKELKMIKDVKEQQAKGIERLKNSLELIRELSDQRKKKESDALELLELLKNNFDLEDEDEDEVEDEDSQ